MTPRTTLITFVAYGVLSCTVNAAEPPVSAAADLNDDKLPAVTVGN